MRFDFKELKDCYKKPSHEKIRAYYNCCDIVNILKDMNSVIINYGVTSYNTFTFVFAIHYKQSNSNIERLFVKTKNNEHLYSLIGMEWVKVF